MIKKLSLVIFSFILFSSFDSAPAFKIARLKYNGGGDWYANKSSLPNLIEFCNKNLKTNIDPEEAVVEPSSPAIFNYPFVHMTGHGNFLLNAMEAENLRNYLIGGGFLHIDDNYGLDPFVRPQLKKVFPDLELVELNSSHPIFHQTFDFPKGLPKIHEHDGKPSQAFGIFYKGRLVVLYTYECDLGNGWEDAGVHNDSEETRLKALKMGANIIEYVFSF